MARRKRMLDDDSSDSSQSEADIDLDDDPDVRDERALFDDPYQRKRRRRNAKEDALYGIFGEDTEDDSFRAKGTGGQKKSDWTKAPAFVSGEKKVDLEKEMEMELNLVSDIDTADDDDAGSEGEDSEARGDEEYSDDSESSRPPSPRVQDNDNDNEEWTSVGGIGLGTAKTTSAYSGGEVRSLADKILGENQSSLDQGIGSSDTPPSLKGDIGVASTSTSQLVEDLPSAFGNRNQRSFARTPNPAKPVVPLNASELAHFNKLQGTFGARMLAKMGWQAGTGLGTTGEGIVTPVESKLRPQKMGIAFKGFKEKTEQSKLEAKRRGEVVSDDEDAQAKKFKRKVKDQAEKRSDVWKRPKKVKTKVEHKTYEQIVAEAGPDTPAMAGIGQIIDATGAVPREVSSLADVAMNSWSPSNDPTRIPEIRHNIRMIADACKSDLDGLAREARALEERKKLVIIEDARLRKKIDNEAELIARLQRVQIVANDINVKAKELASHYEVSLEHFSPLFYTLVDQFSRDFEMYRLDEIVVAAIAPLVRRMVADWNPLEDSTAFVSTFRTWKSALRANPYEETHGAVYDSTAVVTTGIEIEKIMTPFESLLWSVWLPKVRTSINNDWLPDNPQPVVKLYEAWYTFLPPFIRDNLLDQLILPKVQKAVANWNPKREGVPLQTIVFPWLPYIGLRLEDLVGDARRKVKSLLRTWTVGDQIPTNFVAWKDVFDVSEWDAILLKYIVPKLGSTLRDDFRINPREQIMQPIQRVLEWSNIIRPSIFSQILETEFFPKWLDILHVWLIQPQVNYEEVTQWYSFWKGTFPENVQNMLGVSKGFTRGLQLMNTAIELGPKAPSQLVRPDFRAEQAAARVPNHNSGKALSKAPRVSARTHEITFRSIVEEFAASHNLLFIPTGRAHEISRMPLFRVSPTADGKGGLLVYILDDAVWAAEPNSTSFRAISLDDMVSRAVTS